MTNPYVSRGPVRAPEMFYGRTHELEEIVAFLKGNQSISVVGPRKIGKTSLLFNLTRPAVRARLELGPEFVICYLDCEVLGGSNHEEIFGQFAAEIATTLEEQGLPAEPALDAVVEAPNRMALERAVRKLNQRGLRVILMLDEFERLSTNANLDVNFFNALRSAAGRYQLAFVTASAQPLIQLTYSSRSQDILSSPFFNIFAPLFLSLLPENEALALIQEPSRQAGINFTAPTQDFLYALAGGHPLALQVACFHAFNIFSENPQAELKEIQLEIEQRTNQEMAAHYEYYWRNLTLAEQNTLQQLNDVVTRAVADTTLRGILRDLVQKGMLVMDGLTYRYPSRSWGNFVAAQEVARPTPSQIGGVLTGTFIGPYEVLEPLGRGGMSEVYKGRHGRLERMVAIKVLPATLAEESDFRKRFEREARGVAALHHPNIVQMFDFGDLGGTYYMVMEYIDGKDLAQTINEYGQMPLQVVDPIVKDLSSALDYAHSQGFIHRDVKPSNVLLQPAARGLGRQDPARLYRAVLTDFGIAKMVGGDTGATKTGLMMGTLNYMAPEQIRSAGDVDGRADIYALGVMLFQMLTGQLPFCVDNPGAMMLAHLQTPAPDPRILRPDLPEITALAILRSLEKEPDDRFATAGEMAEALSFSH